VLLHGEPKKVHIASVIASKQAVEYLQKTLPMNKTTIWIAAVDEKLNDHAYIVPGIGDAGDLAFGEKID
jgi:uracil phosphoribosyltransferase